MKSPSLRVAQSGAPNSPSRSSSESQCTSAPQRKFIPVTHVHPTSKGLSVWSWCFPSSCCCFKAYHLSAGLRSECSGVYNELITASYTSLCPFSTPTASLFKIKTKTKSKPYHLSLFSSCFSVTLKTHVRCMF